MRYQDQSGASLLSLGGGPRRGNAYLIEGVSITDMLNRASWVPSTEGVEDMKVQLKTYDAEMGRAAGGVFNVTAQVGLQRAGTAARLFMNKPGWGTGKLFFAKIAGTPNPPQYLLLVGGLGGRPDREGQDVLLVQQGRLHAEEHAQQRAHVPDRRASAPATSRSRAATIYDPLTTRPNPNGTGFIRDPFPGNVIPADRINPIALAMLTQMPSPTLGPLVQRLGQPRRRAAGPGNAEDRSALGQQVDHDRHVCPPAHG